MSPVVTTTSEEVGERAHVSPGQELTEVVVLDRVWQWAEGGGEEWVRFFRIPG
jgi:hypothetical protein